MKEANTIQDEQDKLARSHLRGDLDDEVSGRLQRELRDRLDEVRNEIAILSNDYTENRCYLDDCLGLTADPKALYEQSNADTRRLANQVFFRKLYIDETAVGCPPKAHHEMRCDLHYPFDELTSPTVADDARKMVEAGLASGDDTNPDPGSVVACLNLPHLGWLTGLEPATLRTTI